MRNIIILFIALSLSNSMASEILPTEQEHNAEIERMIDEHYIKCMETIEQINETRRSINRDEFISIHCAAFKEDAQSQDYSKITEQDIKTIQYRNTLKLNPVNMRNQ